MKKSTLSLFVATLILVASTAFAAKIATVDIPEKPEMYATAPAALTPQQCAQCHTGAFNGLKTAGGKHRFDCQACHTVIHAYNPKKANYDEVMPKCASCHTDIHGPANKDCASCHNNPHTPRKVAMTQRLATTCATCHAEEKAELIKFPSKHTNVSCDRCHTSHGFKPSCFMCHKPHFKDQPIQACAKCHSVHKPKQVTYQGTDWNQTCASCHSKVAAKLFNSKARHSKVACASCHKAKHGYIPQCTECHKAPHPASILTRFPNCLGCHLDVHDLPSMK